MAQNYVSAEIERPAADVFPWLIEPDKRKIWSFGLEESAAVSAGAPHVGTQYHDVYDLNGRHYEVVTEIVEYAPPERLRLSIVAQRAFHADALYTLRENRGWTSLELEQTTSFRHWAARLLGFVLTRGIQRKLDKDVEALKDALEAS